MVAKLDGALLSDVMMVRWTYRYMPPPSSMHPSIHPSIHACPLQVSVTWTAGAEIRTTVATNGAAAVVLTTSGEVSTYTTYNVVAQVRACCDRVL